MTDLLRLTAPEIVVALAGLLVLILDLGFLHRATLAIRFRAAVVLSCIGCALALGVLMRLPGQGALPEGMLVVNPLTQLVQMALVELAVLVLLLVSSARFTTHVGEYCALLLFATAAMMVLVSTQNLLVIFITIEFLSLSLYILTAFDKQKRGSSISFLAACPRESCSSASACCTVSPARLRWRVSPPQSTLPRAIRY
jgi:NADH-quinone oxidoreductase subunit N